MGNLHFITTQVIFSQFLPTLLFVLLTFHHHVISEIIITTSYYISCGMKPVWSTECSCLWGIHYSNVSVFPDLSNCLGSYKDEMTMKCWHKVKKLEPSCIRLLQLNQSYSMWLVAVAVQLAVLQKGYHVRTHMSQDCCMWFVRFTIYVQ